MPSLSLPPLVRGPSIVQDGRSHARIPRYRGREFHRGKCGLSYGFTCWSSSSDFLHLRFRTLTDYGRENWRRLRAEFPFLPSGSRIVLDRAEQNVVRADRDAELDGQDSSTKGRYATRSVVSMKAMGLAEASAEVSALPKAPTADWISAVRAVDFAFCSAARIALIMATVSGMPPRRFGEVELKLGVDGVGQPAALGFRVKHYGHRTKQSWVPGAGLVVWRPARMESY
jgi:hypothetical protein